MNKLITIAIISPLLFLSACSKEESSEVKKATESVVKEVEKKVEKKINKKLEPKTITLKEVSRIALVEAKQFISELGEKAPNADHSKVNELYKKAESLFEKGEFKQAQKTAVEIRHAAEEILIEAKKKLK